MYGIRYRSVEILLGLFVQNHLSLIGVGSARVGNTSTHGVMLPFCKYISSCVHAGAIGISQSNVPLICHSVVFEKISLSQ